MFVLRWTRVCWCLFAGVWLASIGCREAGRREPRPEVLVEPEPVAVVAVDGWQEPLLPFDEP